MFPFDALDQDNPDYASMFQPNMSFDMSGASGGGDQVPTNDNGPGGNVYAPDVAPPQSHQPNSYLDALQLFQGPNSPIGKPGIDYWNPQNPDYQKYKNLAASTPHSEDIIQSYLNSMPSREDYNPSTGKKIAAFLLDSLANIKSPGNAGKDMESFLTTPYNQALADWKNQGTSVQNEAKLADAARSRELGSLKFGLDQEMAGKKATSLDWSRVTGANQRGAEGVTKSDLADWTKNFKQDQEDTKNQYRSDILDLRQQLENNREQALNDKENGVGGSGSKKLLDPNEFKVHQTAALMGIPEVDKTGHKATTNDLANEIAMMELHQNPVMKDYFKPQEDGTFAIDAGNPTLTEFIQSQVDTLRKKRVRELLGIGGQ